MPVPVPVRTDDAVERVEGEAERAERAQALALDVHVGEEAPVEHQEGEHVLVGRVHVEQVERRGHVPEERVQRVRQHQALLPGLAASTHTHAITIILFFYYEELLAKGSSDIRVHYEESY